MKSNFGLSAISAVFLLLSPFAAGAQDNGSVKDRKFEVAADFTTMTFEPGQTILGFGSRLTYNLNSHIALEAAGYVFPHDCEFCGRHSGRTTEGLFGVKIGKRFDKWGIFGKARPGVISSSKGQFDVVIGTPVFSPPSFLSPPSIGILDKRLTSFALDVGGVVEYYPSKRIITRLDFGSTIIHYSQRTINFPVFDPVTGGFTLRPSTVPAQNRGTLQFMAGVGFRF